MEKQMQACILSGSPEETLAQAKKMAAEALCTGARPRPCGVCPSCGKISRGTHPDLILVERLPDSHGTPRKEIVVEQIRALIASSAVVPNEGRYKIYIFPEAETMNATAQNAFLKLLEEPPAYVRFYLCAEDPQRLLATVRSRCSRIRLGGKAAEVSPRAEQQARKFLEVLDDPVELFRCCAGLMDKTETAAQAMEFVTAAQKLAPQQGFSTEKLLTLEKQLAQAETYLRSNVGVKHVLSFLAVGTNDRK